MLLQFVFAFLSTIGFAVLFNIPKKAILKASFAGGIGWIAYAFSNNYFHSPIVDSFIGACIVAIISEIFARKFKETVTVFVIPGIIPLVPGAGMYYTMMAVVERDFNKFALVGSETMFTAGGIAVALLIVSSMTRMIVQLKTKFKTIKSSM
ncbi:threonine/serine exporter family protein [Marinisporobacter balticus]|uniref:Uncharacterized membrane protein YjjB (DUF3815 family) n=1 Tax=Marinisporobacter balticus TaxID=2018667 RepID=A0A4R2LI93_9FIRM|nr:threonine/serine exporter family protein [Marinisporobacter balticus]TCO79035.1 uncharacterized membrane protein YjjB (DUF3815 family) [Marinisporobacter balticus]